SISAISLGVRGSSSIGATASLRSTGESMLSSILPATDRQPKSVFSALISATQRLRVGTIYLGHSPRRLRVQFEIPGGIHESPENVADRSRGGRHLVLLPCPRYILESQVAQPQDHRTEDVCRECREPQLGLLQGLHQRRTRGSRRGLGDQQRG